jgi:hypothetical protein
MASTIDQISMQHERTIRRVVGLEDPHAGFVACEALSALLDVAVARGVVQGLWIDRFGTSEHPVMVT